MTDCLIVGGGVIGLISAKYLAEAGFCVSVLDKGYYGKESSWAGAGILSPLYPWQYPIQVNDLSQKSQRIYQYFCQQLSKKTGVDVGYRHSGLLIKDNYNNEVAKQWLQNFSIAHKLSPAGLLLPDVGQVRNPNLLSALKTNLIQLGVQIIEQQKAEGFIINGKEINGITTKDKQYKAKHTIICGGAWSGELLKTLPKPELLTADIYPMRGQILLLQLPKSLNLDTIMPHIVLVDNKYFVPRADNLLLVGATFEAVGFNKNTTQDKQDELYQFSLKHYPILKQAKKVKAWSGLRPATHSGKIHIEKSANYTGLYFNAGHFGNGINTALASADELLKNLGKT